LKWSKLRLFYYVGGLGGGGRLEVKETNNSYVYVSVQKYITNKTKHPHP